MEYDCTTCGASGQIRTPKPALDSKGNPTIIFEITTCHVCGGNGKVHVL